jgi:hypothetical protein
MVSIAPVTVGFSLIQIVAGVLVVLILLATPEHQPLQHQPLPGADARSGRAAVPL